MPCPLTASSVSTIKEVVAALMLPPIVGRWHLMIPFVWGDTRCGVEFVHARTLQPYGVWWRGFRELFCGGLVEANERVEWLRRVRAGQVTR